MITLMEEAEVVGVVEAFLVMTLVAVEEVAFLVVGEAVNNRKKIV